MKTCYEAFFFPYFFRTERKESLHITHLVFNVKKKQNNSRATRRCHAKQIFKGVYSKQGILFIWGPKRGPIHGVGLTIFFVSFVV
jgi:hypothetical protein